MVLEEFVLRVSGLRILSTANLRPKSMPRSSAWRALTWGKIFHFPIGNLQPFRHQVVLQSHGNDMCSVHSMVIFLEDIVISANPEIPEGEGESFVPCKPLVERLSCQASLDDVDISDAFPSQSMDW
ncbi:hypothetical protein H5410_064688 [Solanum commersonii]|uniref:Uncharacterized protein n=1 Tax=Solanum commersonii TaxID=4109 RepID=A0A9J5VYR6_SOLCO|nr:hypothetical protein H5410_064688 [Solanum commersonii]